MDKKERQVLRSDLVVYVKKKFTSRQDLVAMAEDIVNEAYMNLLKAKSFQAEKENFAYLSKVCLRVAFRYLKRINRDLESTSPLNQCLNFIPVEDFVEDLIQEEDTKALLDSLETLRQIERIIISQRYFGDLKFHEIAKKNEINLNTVKSHHRRALEKLRRTLSKHVSY